MKSAPSWAACAAAIHAMERRHLPANSLERGNASVMSSPLVQKSKCDRPEARMTLIPHPAMNRYIAMFFHRAPELRSFSFSRGQRNAIVMSRGFTLPLG
jgi:hypothetical protein